MSSVDLYLHEARQAGADADRAREVASRLLSEADGLGARLLHTGNEFTTEVWESAVARSRQLELAAQTRRLRFLEDDLSELVFELRSFADNREVDAAYYRRRHREELLKEVVDGSEPY